MDGNARKARRVSEPSPAQTIRRGWNKPVPIFSNEEISFFPLGVTENPCYSVQTGILNEATTEMLGAAAQRKRKAQSCHEFVSKGILPPLSTEFSVEAGDEPGLEYNSSLEDFTFESLIPGEEKTATEPGTSELQPHLRRGIMPEPFLGYCFTHSLEPLSVKPEEFVPPVFNIPTYHYEPNSQGTEDDGPFDLKRGQELVDMYLPIGEYSDEAYEHKEEPQQEQVALCPVSSEHKMESYINGNSFNSIERFTNYANYITNSNNFSNFNNNNNNNTNFEELKTFDQPHNNNNFQDVNVNANLSNFATMEDCNLRLFGSLSNSRLGVVNNNIHCVSNEDSQQQNSFFLQTTKLLNQHYQHQQSFDPSTLSEQTLQDLAYVKNMQLLARGNDDSYKNNNNNNSFTKSGGEGKLVGTFRFEKETKKRRSKIATSKFRGVSKCGRDGHFQARIRVGETVKYLGRFEDEVEAAKVYDKHAKLLHGHRAVFNFPEDFEQNGHNSHSSSKLANIPKKEF